jgi:hypothetical protein
MEECQKRINKMVEQAKHEAELPLQKPLNALVSGAASLFCFMCTVRTTGCRNGCRGTLNQFQGLVVV